MEARSKRDSLSIRNQILFGGFIFCRCLYEPQKQRMCFVGAGLEFGMVLHAHMEGVVGEFHGLDERAVRRNAGQGESGVCKRLSVVVVELVAVAMALFDRLGGITARHCGVRAYDAGIRAEPERAAFVDVFALAGHEVNDLMSALLVEPRVGQA